jgi:hypothetical protein
MTTITHPGRIPLTRAVATLGIRGLAVTFSWITRTARGIGADAARIAASDQLGQDEETRIGRWTGARV